MCCFFGGGSLTRGFMGLFYHKTFGKHFTNEETKTKNHSLQYLPLNPHPSYYHPSFLDIPFYVNNNFTNSQAFPKLQNTTSLWQCCILQAVNLYWYSSQLGASLCKKIRAPRMSRTNEVPLLVSRVAREPRTPSE